MEQTEIEKAIAKHGQRLDGHDREFHELKKEFHETLGRVDESNKFLREQNNRILEAVIVRNNNADKHDFDLNKINTTNRWKFWLTLISASGIGAVLIQFLTHIVDKF